MNFGAVSPTRAVYQAVEAQFVDLPDYRRMTLVGLHAAELPPPVTLPSEADAAGWAVVADQSLAGAPPARVQAFMDAALATLDPFTRYADAAQSAIENGVREGYGGIGLSFEATGHGLLIRRVFPGGPAAAAGLAPEDLIIAIDGEDARSLTAEEARGRIIGPAGSRLALTLERASAGRRIESLTRRFITPRTVFATRHADLLIIEIDRFNPGTAVELRREIKRNSTPPPRRLLIDLRGNPGGLVEEGVDSADLFLTTGLIARAGGRNPESRQIWFADRAALLPGVPIRLLIDGSTASAAEIMAAALAENGRARLFGRDSFGKGVIQNLLPLPDGGTLYLTWARLTTPLGRPLHRNGVRPHVCLEPTGSGRTLPNAAPAGDEQDAAAVALWRSDCPPQRLTGPLPLTAAAAGEW